MARRLVPALTLLVVVATARSAPGQSLTTVLIDDLIPNPTAILQVPGDGRRMLVTSGDGQVLLVKDNILQPAPFLDLTSQVAALGEGLQSIALHPDYQQNGRFFVVYQDLVNDSWLVEYAVSSDPDVADPGSAVVLRGPVPQPTTIHNWDCVQFGPDGMLYLSTGDGGGVFDPDGNAQNIGVVYGKLMRFDVDAPPPYIPADNPFVGVPGAVEEIWATGLRQPWKFSFDRLTGDLWIGDVGQSLWEEIDFLPADAPGGANFGWPCMEGTNCTPAGCGCNDPSWTDPIRDYPHVPACAVIGGCVYRGGAIAGLDGAYFYADFCSGLFSFRWDGDVVTDFQDRTAELQPCDGRQILAPTAWGEDEDGELYLLDKHLGEIFKVVPADRASFKFCEAAPNSAGTAASIDHVGTTSVAANDLELTVTGAPPFKIGLFFYGPGQDQIPFGDGSKCAAGSIFRLNPPLGTDIAGQASRLVDLTNPPHASGQILPGSVWSFQFWYRDPAGGPAGYNLSDGLRVTFCP